MSLELLTDDELKREAERVAAEYLEIRAEMERRLTAPRVLEEDGA